jgi:peptide/nickel transport system permease protein
LIPQFILAEVTLSFLGLGVGEPLASWGGMLAGLQQYHVILSDWWMFFPGIFLVFVFLGYSRISSALQKSTHLAGIASNGQSWDQSR